MAHYSIHPTIRTCLKGQRGVRVFSWPPQCPVHPISVSHSLLSQIFYFPSPKPLCPLAIIPQPPRTLTGLPPFCQQLTPESSLCPASPSCNKGSESPSRSILACPEMRHKCIMWLWTTYSGKETLQASGEKEKKRDCCFSVTNAGTSLVHLTPISGKSDGERLATCLSSGCHHRIPRVTWLKKTLLSHNLETEMSKIKELPHLFSCKNSFPGLQTAAFSLCSGLLSSSSISTLLPSWGPHSHDCL